MKAEGPGGPSLTVRAGEMPRASAGPLRSGAGGLKHARRRDTWSPAVVVQGSQACGTAPDRTHSRHGEDPHARTARFHLP
jgi:hypothetical protein